MKMGKGKGEGEGEGEEEGKGEEKGKVGRTHGHSGGFILCPMLLHCTGQTITLQSSE